jgi:hypothetical protein
MAITAINITITRLYCPSTVPKFITAREKPVIWAPSPAKTSLNMGMTCTTKTIMTATIMTIIISGYKTALRTVLDMVSSLS